MATASEIPPAPVWNENSSTSNPDARITFCSRLCDGLAYRVRGGTCRSRQDPPRVSDRGDLHDVVNKILRNVDRACGERNQVIGYGDHALGMLGIDHCIAEWPAGGRSKTAADVSIVVRTGCSDECGIDR